MAVIQKTGPHREVGGGKAHVEFLGSMPGVAFGYDSQGRPTAWECETGATCYGKHIAAEWQDPPAFSVGDLVLVDKPGSGDNQCYASVVCSSEVSVVVEIVGKPGPQSSGEETTSSYLLPDAFWSGTSRTRFQLWRTSKSRGQISTSQQSESAFR